jgi:hypothetical protein
VLTAKAKFNPQYCKTEEKRKGGALKMTAKPEAST